MLFMFNTFLWWNCSVHFSVTDLQVKSVKQFENFLLILIVHLQAKCQESHDDDYGFISNLVTCLRDNPLQTHAQTYIFN